MYRPLRDQLQFNYEETILQAEQIMKKLGLNSIPNSFVFEARNACDLLLKDIYEYNKNFLKGSMNNEYSIAKINYFIGSVLKLSAILNLRQIEQEKITEQAMFSSVSNIYSDYKSRTVDFKSDAEKEAFLLLYNSINIDIKKITNDYIKVISSAFGPIDSESLAVDLINRELNHVKNYAKVLNEIDRFKLSDLDNVYPIIETLKAVAYEGVQLIAVAERSKKFYIEKQNITQKEFRPYCVFLDGIDSTKTYQEIGRTLLNNYSMFKAKLNEELKINKDVQLLSEFDFFKQDEFEGIINGDMNKFVAIVKTLSEKYNINVRVAYSNKGIDNVEELIKQDTFRSCGKGWIECRDKINANKVIEINHGVASIPARDNELSDK